MQDQTHQPFGVSPPVGLELLSSEASSEGDPDICMQDLIELESSGRKSLDDCLTTHLDDVNVDSFFNHTVPTSVDYQYGASVLELLPSLSDADKPHQDEFNSYAQRTLNTKVQLESRMNDAFVQPHNTNNNNHSSSPSGASSSPLMEALKYPEMDNNTEYNFLCSPMFTTNMDATSPPASPVLRSVSPSSSVTSDVATCVDNDSSMSPVQAPVQAPVTSAVVSTPSSPHVTVVAPAPFIHEDYHKLENKLTPCKCAT